MMVQSHLFALETKHADLDKRIDEEIHRPQPDTITIADLKKQKLKLKEKMLLN